MLGRRAKAVNSGKAWLGICERRRTVLAMFVPVFGIVHMCTYPSVCPSALPTRHCFRSSVRPAAFPPLSSSIRPSVDPSMCPSWHIDDSCTSTQPSAQVTFCFPGFGKMLTPAEEMGMAGVGEDSQPQIPELRQVLADVDAITVADEVPAVRPGLPCIMICIDIFCLFPN